MLIADYLKEWLSMMTTQIRHNTLDCYWYMFRRHLYPFFHARHLTFRTVTVSDFQAFVDEKYKEGYSPTSILKFHTVVHKCMKYAVIQGLIDHNPSDYVILPKRKKYIGRIFTRDQLHRFIQEARSSPAEPAFMLAAVYGLRRSEAAGLRWQCVDFSGGSISINHTAISSCGKVTYSDRVKTASSYRTLPLMDSMRVYLLQLKKEQQELRLHYGPDYHQTDYVCCRADGTPLRPDYISQEFAKVCRRARPAAYPLPRSAAHRGDPSAAAGLLAQAYSGVAGTFRHLHDSQHLRAHRHSDKKQMADELNSIFENT